MRRRVRTPVTDVTALHALIREFAAYVERCRMDAAADDMICRTFGDPQDADADPFLNAFLPDPATCAACNGSGDENATAARACPACKGCGLV